MNKEILRLAIPSILANITVPIVGIVDVAIAGHIANASAIGGIAIGTMLFDLLYWNFGFLRVGTGGMTAQAYGRRDRQAIMDIFSGSITLSLAGALLVWAIGWPFVDLVMRCVPCSPEVEMFARQYFWIRIWAAPATLSLMVFKGWFIGMQNTVYPMICDITVNVVNMAASFCLAVYTPLGAIGVAYGTLIAQYTGLLTAMVLMGVGYRRFFQYIRLWAKDEGERLRQMPAAMLAKAEVMPSAPAKYHVRGMAINIVTKDFTGTNQLSGQLMGGWRQHKYGTGYAGGSVIYNHGKLGIDASYMFTDGTSYGQVEHEANHPLNGQRMAYSDKTRNRSNGVDHEYHIGMDYAISENHNLSLAYTGQWNSTRSTNTTTGTAQSTQNSRQHTYLHNVDANYSAPFGLQLGASYTNYQEPRTQNLDGQLNEMSRNLYVDSRQKVSKWLFTADQTHSLPKGWELNYGGKAQFTNNNSYQTTFNADHQPLPDATSHVDYNERILNAYAGFSKQIGQSFSLDASLTAEQYHATKWNEWRIYPQFNAMWNINEKNMLNLSFSSEAIYPSYWSTMSSIYYASAYSEIWSNPDLKPMSKYDINLMWQLNHKYTFTAFVMLEPDYFVQMAYQPTDRMAVIMKETNFDCRWPTSPQTAWPSS